MRINKFNKLPKKDRELALKFYDDCIEKLQSFKDSLAKTIND